MQHMWKRVSAQIHKSQQSRNGRPHLGKESQIFKRLQTLGFRILKDILFSARAQTHFHTHMGKMGPPVLEFGPIFERVSGLGMGVKKAWVVLYVVGDTTTLQLEGMPPLLLFSIFE